MAKKDTKEMAISTSKMPKETEKQYFAWVLYCEVGSIHKLLRQWQKLHQGYTNSAPEIAGLREKLGPVPGERTLKSWSKKYHWVARNELKLKEDIEAMREKTKRYKAERAHRVAEYFDKVMTQLMKKVREGGEVTTADLKQIWEMFRTEMGETLGKHTHAIGIDESKQTPPTEEEIALGEALDNTVIEFYEKRGRKTQQSKHPPMDSQ